MSLIPTERFKDLCEDSYDEDEKLEDNEDPEDQDQSVFNSLGFHDISFSKNPSEIMTEDRENNSIEDISEDKLSNDNNEANEEKRMNEHLSVNIYARLFEKGLQTQVRTDENNEAIIVSKKSCHAVVIK